MFDVVVMTSKMNEVASRAINDLSIVTTTSMDFIFSKDQYEDPPSSLLSEWLDYQTSLGNPHNYVMGKISPYSEEMGIEFYQIIKELHDKGLNDKIGYNWMNLVFFLSKFMNNLENKLKIIDSYDPISNVNELNKLYKEIYMPCSYLIRLMHKFKLDLESISSHIIEGNTSLLNFHSNLNNEDMDNFLVILYKHNSLFPINYNNLEKRYDKDIFRILTNYLSSKNI